MKNKKVVYTIIGIVSIALIALAITYAYWQITKTQTGENLITAACLDISISDEANDINLQSQYPITDTEGVSLTPYTFTVTNNCDTAVDYHVNLEAIGDSTTALKSSSIKVMLDDSAALLSSKSAATPTISGAYASYKIGTGTLAAKDSEGDSVSHTLRLWVDEEAPVSEADKTFESKISVTIGQGIKASTFEKGSLAYTLVKTAGGEDSITSLNYEKEDRVVSTSNSLHMNASSSYYWGTTYSVDASGNYTLGGTIVKSTLDECRSGTNTCGNYTLTSTSSETTTNAYIYEITDFKTSGDYVVANRRKYTTLFEVPTTENDAGMYKAEDDYGDSYYYRGNVTNNYVQFGTASSGASMYWRVVRINGDGTARLIYAGTSKVANGEGNDSIIEFSNYNNNYDNKMYVGYMYGTESDPYGDNESTTLTSSTIKDSLDTWYEANLKTNYETYIADSVFCNDREEWIEDEYGLYYDVDNRLTSTYEPVLTCSNQRDRFTVDDTTVGNGQLINPVGLLTADEAVMAGYSYGVSTTSNYLYNGGSFWTSSPIYFDADGADVFDVHYNTLSSGGYVDSSHGARPVINLKSDVEFTIDEDGTYVITTN